MKIVVLKHNKCPSTPQDEDVYTFFEPVLPTEAFGITRAKAADGVKSPCERKSSFKLPANKNGQKPSNSRPQRPSPNSEKKAANHNSGSGRRQSPEKSSWNVLDLKVENYFSCAVGRPRTNARYSIGSSDDVVSFLKELAIIMQSSWFHCDVETFKKPQLPIKD